MRIFPNKRNLRYVPKKITLVIGADAEGPICKQFGEFAFCCGGVCRSWLRYFFGSVDTGRVGVFDFGANGGDYEAICVSYTFLCAGVFRGVQSI